jgi:CheY-like chemotaxis protein
MTTNPLEGKKVLVVEDHPLAAPAILATVTAFGCRVLGPAATQEGALEMVERHQPDGVLLDLGLASGSGSDLADEFTKRKLPFIIVTAQAPPGRHKACRVVRKPFSSEELRTAMVACFCAGCGDAGTIQQVDRSGGVDAMAR